jgi:hypothetical protein
MYTVMNSTHTLQANAIAHTALTSDKMVDVGAKERARESMPDVRPKTQLALSSHFIK